MTRTSMQIESIHSGSWLQARSRWHIRFPRYQTARTSACRQGTRAGPCSGVLGGETRAVAAGRSVMAGRKLRPP